jgi:heat shock protein HslJ
LVGFAGCNTYNGRYTATDNGDNTYSVVIGTLATSRRSCPADIMTQESNYLAAFEQVTSAAIRENMLTLTYPAGTLVFYMISGQ